MALNHSINTGAVFMTNVFWSQLPCYFSKCPMELMVRIPGYICQENMHTFLYFSRRSHPEQFTGGNRDRCLAQGHIYRLFTQSAQGLKPATFWLLAQLSKLLGFSFSAYTKLFFQISFLFWFSFTKITLRQRLPNYCQKSDQAHCIVSDGTLSPLFDPNGN